MTTEKSDEELGREQHFAEMYDAVPAQTWGLHPLTDAYWELVADANWQLVAEARGRKIAVARGCLMALVKDYQGYAETADVNGDFDKARMLRTVASRLLLLKAAVEQTR